MFSSLFEFTRPLISPSMLESGWPFSVISLAAAESVVVSATVRSAILPTTRAAQGTDAITALESQTILVAIELRPLQFLDHRIDLQASPGEGELE
eukprot:scaffold264090_cov29-Prasinocladus_malaysianus.AAC.2